MGEKKGKVKEKRKKERGEELSTSASLNFFFEALNNSIISLRSILQAQQ